MLLVVWSKLSHAPVAESTLLGAITQASRRGWFWRQLKSCPSYRLLYAYNAILGATVGAALLFGKLLAPAWMTSHTSLIGHSLLNLLLIYIRDSLLVNSILIGAIIVRGPLAPAIQNLATELAERLDPRGCIATEILPSHGARLIVQIALVGPTMMMLGLLVGERGLGHFAALTLGFCLLLAAIVVTGSVAGIAAVSVRRRVRRHAVLTWFAIWAVPELIRWIFPAMVTPRSLVEGGLALASSGWRHL